MSTPQRYRRKAWRRGKSFQQTRLSRRDKVRLLIVVIIMSITGLLMVHFVTDLKVDHVRKRSLASMQERYALNEEQVEAIKEIETLYHGRGSIFTIPARNFEEESSHLQAISQQMSPDAAARFLDAKRGKKGSPLIEH